MKNNVRKFIFSSNKGENLNNSECFEETLKKAFLFLEEKKIEKELVSLIRNDFKKQNTINYLQDFLNVLVETELFLDFFLAQKINRLDIIDSECFRYNTDLGKAIYTVLLHADFELVVRNKLWCNEKSLYLEFEASQEENSENCIYKISTGKYLRSN